MTSTTVTRYICDFCGKKGYSAGHMRNHEKHCTMNINRECRMCDGFASPPVLPLVVPEFALRKPPDYWDDFAGKLFPALFTAEESKQVIEDAQHAADFCPACTLAILRLSDLTKSLHDRFDFAKEAEAYLKEKHALMNEGAAYGGMW